VFGVVCLTGLVLIVGAVGLGLAVGFAGGFDEESAEDLTAPTTPLMQGVILLLMTPLQVLISIVPVVVYHDLRVGKEGVDVEDLLKVFA
jgi:hypothetical protein